MKSTLGKVNNNPETYCATFLLHGHLSKELTVHNIHALSSFYFQAISTERKEGREGVFKEPLGVSSGNRVQQL